MANNDIKVLTFIANEMLRQVKNNLQFVKNCSGEEFEGRFTQSPKAGETIKIRKPTRYAGRTGETYSEESYLERTVDFTVQTTDGVDITLTNRELMFNLDKIAERVIKPAALTLANKIDTKALILAYQATANAVGIPGTVPTALRTYNQARAKVAWEGGPEDEHIQLLSPDMQVELVDAVKGLFQPVEKVAMGFNRGKLNGGANADWYEVQNLPLHVVGPLGGTPLMNGTTASGATTLVTNGWTASAAARLKKGDVFTVAAVNAVNPWTGISTGALRQFVVGADVSSDGSGNLTIALGGGQSVISTGPFKNVDALPLTSAAITVLGAANTKSVQGLRFVPEAFLFGTFEQPEPGGVEFAKTSTDKDTGISIRFIRDWDTLNNKQLNRMECVWAFGIAFPEWACRVAS